MTAVTGDMQTQIGDLRAETVAAIEQRDLFAAEARRTLIAAWEAGRICRTGCAEALTGWGLEPPPGELTMSADGRMSYARMHTDEGEAREEALQHVPEQLSRLLPEVAVWPRWVVEVALIAGEDDHPEVHPYRITVQVRLRARVTASSTAAATTSAETMVTARLPELADADVTLTGLTWEVHDGPDDLIHSADTDAQPPTDHALVPATTSPPRPQPATRPPGRSPTCVARSATGRSAPWPTTSSAVSTSRPPSVSSSSCSTSDSTACRGPTSSRSPRT